MSTEEVLFKARLAVAQARDNELVTWIMFLLLVGGLVMWFEYVLRRWSWIPRNRHRRQYIEKF